MGEQKQELKLLAMEENLAGPQGEAYAKKYDHLLLRLKKRAQAALDEGLEQQQFPAVQALAQAADVARKVIIFQREK